MNFHKKLSWTPHINKTAKKADGTRAFLQRNLKGTPYGVKKQCFESLVRPILEYGGIVWDPHTKLDCYQLEMVQRRFARFITQDYSRSSSVTAKLTSIGWDTLEERRGKARTTMIYRIKEDLVDISAEEHLSLQTTRGRSLGDKFQVPYARIQSYQKSFFPVSESGTASRVM